MIYVLLSGVKAEIVCTVLTRHGVTSYLDLIYFITRFPFIYGRFKASRVHRQCYEDLMNTVWCLLLRL